MSGVKAMPLVNLPLCLGLKLSKICQILFLFVFQSAGADPGKTLDIAQIGPSDTIIDLFIIKPKFGKRKY